MTTGQHGTPQSAPDLPSPDVAGPRRVRQPLDRTQLWVAVIAAGGAVVAAAIAAAGAFAAGWLHYSGPGVAAPAPAVTTAALLPSSGTGPSATVQSSATAPSSAETAKAVTSALYLASRTASTAATAAFTATGSWAIASVNYGQSVGYPELCTPGDVTYNLNGPYKYFIAAVGIADGADPGDRSSTVNFDVRNGESGNVLTSKVAQYGHPQIIDVPVRGISSITLQTSIANGQCFGSASVAIWGNVRLVRLLDSRSYGRLVKSDPRAQYPTDVISAIFT